MKRNCVNIKVLEGKMMENNFRILTKSVTFRIIGFTILTLLTYYTTNNLFQATFISITFQVIQFFTYYFHEKIWEKIKWGTQQICPKGNETSQKSK